MRAVAVAAVVIFHARLPVTGGYVGVDVFFVISGFLITSHLVSELRHSGRVNFARFYARRARRILPASFTVLIATLAAAVFVLPPTLLNSVARDAVATALYVPNMLFAWRGTDYLAETAPSPFQHYWSLGVEEQFYIFWPLLLLAIWLLVPRPRLRLALVVAVMIGSFVVGVLLTYESQPWAFFSLPSRAWQLGVGAVLAVAGPELARRLPAAGAAIGGWLGLAAVLITAVVYNDQTIFPGTAALIPTLGCAAVIFFGQHATTYGPGLVLAVKPLQWLGGISYSLYLVHWPLMVLPTYLRGKEIDLPWVAYVGLLVVAVVLAYCLNRWVENPLRSSGARQERPRSTLVVAGVASLLSVALAVGVVAYAQSRPISSDRPAAGDSAAQLYPTFTAYVPSNLTPSLADASGDIPITYLDGCHLDVADTDVRSCVFGDLDSEVDVVLFGDSHAAQWFPPLDELGREHGFRLTVFTKSSCPSANVAIVVDDVPYESCDLWREAVIAEIARIDPRLVILSNLADYGEQAPTLTDESWAAGLTETLARLPASAAVAVFADTPSFGQTPGICLSANVDDALFCSMTRADVLRPSRASAEREAASAADAQYSDFNDRLCDPTTCGAIIGNLLVYRDGNHMTATFATSLAPVVWESISSLLEATG